MPHKSEFTSPKPPHNLRFSDGGAEEVDAFVRVLRTVGGAATSLMADTCLASTSVHVHVNVRHPQAGGTLLTARELLNVLWAFVEFDHVLARFARPWFWLEPSAVPLLATGPEIAPNVNCVAPYGPFGVGPLTPLTP